MLRAIIVDDSDLVSDRLVGPLSSLPEVEVVGLEGEAHYTRTTIQLESLLW